MSATYYARIGLDSLKSCYSLQVFIIAVSTTSILWNAYKSKEFDVFAPQNIVAVVYVVIFAIGSVSHIIINSAVVVLPLTMVSVSLVGFMIGCRLPLGKRLQKISGDFRVATNRYNGRSVRFIVVGVMGVATLATVFMVLKVGFPFLYENKIVGRLDARRAVTSWTTYGMGMSNIAFFIYLGYKASYGNGLTKRDVPKLMVFWLVVAFMNAIPGWRNPVIFFALGTIAVLNYTSQRVSVKKATLVGFGITFLTIGWGLIRVFSGGAASAGVEYLANIASTSLRLYLMIGTLSLSVYSYGLIQVAKIVPEEMGFTYGGIYLSTWITALPGETKTIGKLVKEASGLEFDGPGINVTLVGEAFIDFGFVGVFSYSLIYGILLATLYRRVRYSFKSAILYAYVIMTFSIGIMTGVLGQAVYTFNLIVIVVLLNQLRPAKQSPKLIKSDY